MEKCYLQENFWFLLNLFSAKSDAGINQSSGRKKMATEKRSPVLQHRTQMGSRGLCDLRQRIASSQEKCNLWPTCNLTMRKKIRQFSSPKETDKSYVYINWHPLLNFPWRWITRSPHIFCRVLTIMKKQIKIHQCKTNVCNTPTHLYGTWSEDIWIKQQLSIILSIIFLQSLRTFSDSE